MRENQKAIFSMYYNQKNTCAKVKIKNLVCTTIRKYMCENRKPEFSMYSGSKKQDSGSFTTETCFEFDLAWLVAMLALSFWIFSRNQ